MNATATLEYPGRLPGARRWLGEALVLTRRELVDTMSDWRLTFPIVVLTLIFPFFMQFVARMTEDWVRYYGGPQILSERSFPLMLMVVGFFPLSFSLVIALEAFVGEKERKSLEPLLSTPLTNGQLYFGKMLASLIPTVSGSYLGIGVYLTAMYFNVNWQPSLSFVFLVMALMTAKAVVMVSGAVIVSAQTTSVRAANLIASFIILPMTVLVQIEGYLMFWGLYATLWSIFAGLIVVDILLARMGMQLFDREELLGREIDEINLPMLWRTFKRFWARVDPTGPTEPVTLGRIYRRDVPAILRRLRLPTVVVTVALAAALAGGAWLASRYPLPPGSVDPSDISMDAFARAQIGFLPAMASGWVLFHNMRALLIAAGMAIISFGALAIIALMLPMGIIGLVAGEFAILGYSPLVFLATFILPHGVFELPAATLVNAAAVRLGAAIITRQPGLTVSENWLAALVDFIKIFVFVAVPLLLIAALVEINITPRIVVWAYTGR